MYCPLCKTEYRDGFDKCSDCLVPLVPTLEQAKSVDMVLLWNGTSQRRFNDIAGALQDAGIPAVSRSAVRTERSRPWWTYIPIIYAFFRYKEMYDQMTWEISVANSDYRKAQAIVESQK